MNITKPENNIMLVIIEGFEYLAVFSYFKYINL